jgi:hypothetical protein
MGLVSAQTKLTELNRGLKALKLMVRTGSNLWTHLDTKEPLWTLENTETGCVMFEGPSSVVLAFVCGIQYGVLLQKR